MTRAEILDVLRRNQPELQAKGGKRDGLKPYVAPNVLRDLIPAF